MVEQSTENPFGQQFLTSNRVASSNDDDLAAGVFFSPISILDDVLVFGIIRWISENSKRNSSHIRENLNNVAEKAA